MQQDNTLKGVGLMILAMFIFAMQDGISKKLGHGYSPVMITLIRFWFFAVVVVVWAAVRSGGIRHAAHSAHPRLQILRGLILVFQIVIMINAFVKLGLVATHAVFIACPLIVAALSGPLLGERVGWRRWSAIGVGLAGVLVVLRPGVTVFTANSALPLIGAFMFAIYTILTRYVARNDGAATSFFWTGVAGAFGISFIGPFYLTPMAPADWVWMGTLCLTSIAGHFVLITAYEAAEASRIQPFTYFQFVFTIGVGVIAFGERPDLWTYAGAAIVIGSGLFTLWREHVARRRQVRALREAVPRG